MSGPQHYPGPARLMEKVYKRLPVGWKRVLAAGVAGVIMMLLAVAGRDRTLVRDYWPWLAGTGFLLGTLGGWILNVLEKNQAIGKPAPAPLRKAGTAGKWFLISTLIILFAILLYGLLLVCKMNHLYGF